MAITLTYGVTTLQLPKDLIWADEFAWRQVEQRQEYTLTGALVVEAYAKQAGRPITLRGGNSHGWIMRETLQLLRQWAALPAQQFTLVWYGAAPKAVAFDHQGGAIEAAPIIDYANPRDDDYYMVTLRFIEV